MTTLEAVQVCALYMQRRFMAGVAYGTPGTPNMQSILELSSLPDAQAHEMVANELPLATIALERGLL